MKKNKKSVEEAKVSSTDFYGEYNRKKEERRKKNRSEQEVMLAHRDSQESGKVWERINDMVDLSQKGQKSTRDVSRFRTILVQLKTDSSAPGA